MDEKKESDDAAAEQNESGTPKNDIVTPPDNGLNGLNENGGIYACSVTDGTAVVLRTFEFDGYRMLGDHTSSAYSAAIQTYLDKLEEDQPPTEVSSTFDQNLAND